MNYVKSNRLDIAKENKIKWLRTLSIKLFLFW